MSSRITPLYRGTAEADRLSSDDLVDWLEKPPPWRDHRKTPAIERAVPENAYAARRGKTYETTGTIEQDAVNLALWLRRPLLVTGDAGVGKSSLAYGIAHALQLGAPLRWEIHSKSTLKEGLYTYDAIGHFRASRTSEASRTNKASGGQVSPQEYVTLGPLGTAFLPTHRPRVLLIDELDKASWDLPNSLLHIFEEGAFRIPELDEHDGTATVKVFDSESPADRVPIHRERVRVLRVRHHPVVVITSNGDREFSSAFLRRCVQLKMKKLDTDVLTRVVKSQFAGHTLPTDLEAKLGELGDVETDIALQTLFAVSVGGDLKQVRDLLSKNRGPQ
jgi:MoxR-like ATPase